MVAVEAVRVGTGGELGGGGGGGGGGGSARVLSGSSDLSIRAPNACGGGGPANMAMVAMAWRLAHGAARRPRR